MASTGISPNETTAFRRGKLQGKELTAQEREKLLKPYLPPEPVSSSSPSRAPSPSSKSKQSRRSGQKPHKSRRSGLFRQALHVLIYTVVSFIFSVFFRFRRSWRLVKSKVVSLLKYHHRTPEFIQRDTKHLERLPQHLSVILELHEDDEEQGTAGLEGLVNDVCEIAAWTASAGIPFLSIYERTGTCWLYTLTLYRMRLMKHRYTEELHPASTRSHLANTRSLLWPPPQTDTFCPRTPSPIILATTYTA